MPPSCPEPSALYPRIAGPDWLRVNEVVRAAHLDEQNGRLCARGAFTIRHGESCLARLLVRAARMPAEGDDVETRLVIVREREGEQWCRTFAGQEMTTIQYARPGPVLAERFGVLELRFRLEIEDGAVVYRQIGACLRLGRLCVPIPRRFSPQVAAREEPAGLPDRTRVTVDVSLPLVGPLIRYAGEIEPEGTE
jgi:hypothetical protein